MVQVLVWNGEDRPPIVVVESLPFSNGNPSVNDTLQVVRGGSVVGTVTLERVQAARRRAFVEIASGQMPEAGDILRHNGDSEATIESVTYAPARRGDIVDIIETGRHPGRKIVTGPNWDDPVDYRTELERALTLAERQAGQWPDYVIFDVPTVASVDAGWLSLANRAASIFGYAGTPRRLPDVLRKAMKVDYTIVPAMVRNLLRDDGRATATGAQLLPYLTLKDGITRQTLEDRMTFNGRFPEELTTYL